MADGLPMINDLMQQGQNLTGMTNDKLKEAQGILQSALDTHVLLSHYGWYKKLSGDAEEALNNAKSTALDMIGKAGGEGNSLINPAEMISNGINKINSARRTLNTQIENVKQLQQQGKDIYNNMGGKARQLEAEGQDALNATRKNITNKIKTSVEKVKTEVGDKVVDAKSNFKTKLDEGQEYIKSQKEGMTQQLKSTTGNAEKETEGMFSRIKNAFTSSPKQTVEESLPKMPEITMEDPADSPLLSGLSQAGQKMVDMKAQKFINDYYATEQFPDDIFADTLESNGAKIRLIPGVKAPKKLLKKGGKKKTVKQEEEQQKKATQDNTVADEEANARPALSTQGQDALFPMREAMAKKNVMKPSEETESATKQEESEPIENMQNSPSDMSTDEIKSRMANMEGARSPQAEQEYQQLKTELQSRQTPQMEEPAIATRESDLMGDISMNGTVRSGIQATESAVQSGVNEVNRIGQQAQQNMQDAYRTFSDITSQGTNDVQTIAKSVSNAVSDKLSGLTKSLGTATEESAVDDEDPLGLAITVGLGLATLGTQIADFFKKPPHEVIAQTGEQIGV